MNCIFCKIINGEIPSYTVFEDDLVKVFMDINPASDGHLLIIPKEHYKDIGDIPMETVTHIHKISKEMFKLLKEKLNIDGLTIMQNNEYGQEVKHYHMHLIPRYNDDKIDFINSNNKNSVEVIYKKISN